MTYWGEVLYQRIRPSLRPEQRRELDFELECKQYGVLLLDSAKIAAANGWLTDDDRREIEALLSQGAFRKSSEWIRELIATY